MCECIYIRTSTCRCACILREEHNKLAQKIRALHEPFKAHGLHHGAADSRTCNVISLCSFLMGHQTRGMQVMFWSSALCFNSGISEPMFLQLLLTNSEAHTECDVSDGVNTAVNGHVTYVHQVAHNRHHRDVNHSCRGELTGSELYIHTSYLHQCPCQTGLNVINACLHVSLYWQRCRELLVELHDRC